MDSSDLTRGQVERLRRRVALVLDYDLRLYRRCRDAGFPDDDPLLLNVCRAWQSVAHVADVVDDVHRRLPRLYRPLAEPTKKAGLRERELPWAQKQIEAAREVERRERGDWRGARGGVRGNESGAGDGVLTTEA